MADRQPQRTQVLTPRTHVLDDQLKMMVMKIRLLVVEDNSKLRPAMTSGLNNTGDVEVLFACGSGEEALDHCLAAGPPDGILMDVQLEGQMNGIEAAVAIRREFPRLPVVFYSIQDDDAYYRAFQRSGILSHYAYVRKSSYLLPAMIVPLFQDAIDGRSFIEPEIEARVMEVRQKDEQSPIALLEPNEHKVALMLAQGMSNRQIADQMGFRDKRTISRINGQIYTALGLNETTTDEKVARTRVAIMLQTGRLMWWNEDGRAHVMDSRGHWVPFDPD